MNYPGFIKKILSYALLVVGLGIVGALWQPQSAQAAANVTFLKTTNSSSANGGDTITYTIKATNSGDMSASGVTVSDDLTNILDDANYNNDLALTGPGQVAYNSPNVSWSGDLGIGQTATITFTVTIKNPDPGNALLTNTLVSNQGNCQSGSTDLRCTKTVNVSRVAFTKVANTNTLTPGGTVQYTITISSNGTADAGAVQLTDDLSQVLDDASYNNDAQLTGPNGSIAYSSPNLTYNVPFLSVGQTATITYSVTVDNPPEGDESLTNTIVTNQGNCKQGSTDASCTVQIGETSGGTSNIQISKAVSASNTTEGSQITYTITAHNSGTAAGDATFTDNLSGVLDDATFDSMTGDSTINGQFSSVNQTMTYTVTSLAAGDDAVATYTVTVNTPDTGDRLLTNVLNGLNCTSAAVAGCSTTTTVAPVEPEDVPVTVTETVSPSQAQPGQTLTFTITAANDNDTSKQLSLAIDLTDVLDDATYNQDAAASIGTITFSQPTLTWLVNIPAGQTATASYTVTVKPSDSGNGTMKSTVSDPDAISNCEEGSTDSACVATAAVLADEDNPPGEEETPPTTPSSPAPGGSGTTISSSDMNTKSSDDLAKTGESILIVALVASGLLGIGMTALGFRKLTN